MGETLVGRWPRERRMLTSASSGLPSVALCWRVSTRRAGATASDTDR
jgi:hypothetical protein